MRILNKKTENHWNFIRESWKSWITKNLNKNKENHEKTKMQLDNFENNENLKIQYKNKENHENHKNFIWEKNENQK